MDLEKFRQIVKDTGSSSGKKDLADAILKNLSSVPKKSEYQNILNSSMKEAIKNLLTERLPEKFDYDRFSFAEDVIANVGKLESLY